MDLQCVICYGKAWYIYKGSSYCQTHLKRMQQISSKSKED